MTEPHGVTNPPFGQPLGADWYAAQPGVRALLDEARARVVRWKWGRSGSALEDPRPLLTECEWGFVPRLLDRRPAPDCRRYGLDAAGTVLLAEDVEAGRSGDTVTWVAFWLEQDDGTRVLVRCQVRAPATPVLESLVSACEREDGQLDRVDMWVGPSGRFTYVKETYDYADGHVSAIERSWVTHDGHLEGRRFDVARSAGDDVLRITCVRQRDGQVMGGPYVLFRRTTPTAAKAARKRVLRVLPDLVAAWIDRIAPEESCWALFLVYGDAEPLDGGLGLALATDAERKALADPDNEEAIWNPADYRTFDVRPPELNRPEFVDDWHTVVSELIATDRPVRDLAAACARHLRDARTAETHSRTRSALIVPVDVELVDLDANLRAAKLTAAARRRLERGSDLRH